MGVKKIIPVTDPIDEFLLGEHFRGQQYMDGTPHVTQCPILPHNK